MFGVVFGFSGRIGRLQYFLLSSFLAAVTTALVFAVVFGMAAHDVPTGTREGAVDHTLLVLLVTVAPLFTWFSFALQAKRIRDIGWSPAVVIPAWIAANVVGSVLVRTGAVHATVGHDGTALGALVNLAMTGALLFWPSGEPDHRTPPSGRSDPPPVPRPSPAPVRAYRVEGGPAPVPFGRRGRG